MSVVSGLMLEIASKQSTVITEGVSAMPVMASEPLASVRQILKEAISKNIWFC